MKGNYALLAVLALAIAGGMGGCRNESGEKPAVTTPTATAGTPAATPSPAGTAWDDEALRVAEQLASTVRAAGIPCNNFEVAPFALHAADSGRSGLPLPKARASCTSENEEDLTFHIFESPRQAQEYIDAKQALLCKRAAAVGLAAFPGFPYIIGGAWIVEPDEKATAERLAPIVGGEAKMGSCGG